MWITKKSYQLMVELKQASDQKAKFFEQLNFQLTRENRRLIERLLAKGNVPMVESPENIIQQVIGNVPDYKEESNGDIFEDDDTGEPIIRDSNDQKRQQQESDQMEYQP